MGMASKPVENGTEIVIGLVGAIGVDMDMIQRQVAAALKHLDFNAVPIHLSMLLESIGGLEIPAKAKSDHYDEMVDGLMDAGTALRSKFGGDAMAQIAIAAIMKWRESKGSKEIPINRQAYVLRQLKHPDEVDLLREVYGDSFFVIAAYSPKETRLKNITEKIRKSRSRHRGEDFEALAIKLMKKDEEEPERKLGQHVRQTFWRGDAYIDATSEEKTRIAIQRILNLWFGSPFITPTRDEFGMFVARAAALRSACMGRQVGACIATKDGAVMATGTNEIPKARGGQYWEGDPGDARDHVKGFDSSEQMRKELLSDVLEKLIEAKWRVPEGVDEKTPPPKLAESLLKTSVFERAEIQALTEYQRPVHAEMAALSDAALRGVSVANATLYTTTFPCHGCARHIVASGITRVVYIEPYAKSLVKTLYEDSISVDDDCEDGRVRFMPYIGLAPRRYLDLFRFSAEERKEDSGQRKEWDPQTSSPRVGNWESWLAIERENRLAVDIRLQLGEGDSNETTK